MKKVLFVLAFVAVYGVSMAMSGSNVVTVDDTQVTIVADMDDNSFDAPEGEKEKEKGKTVKAKGDTKAKSDAKGEAKAKAKGEGCSGAKAKSGGCGSACGGEKK